MLILFHQWLIINYSILFYQFMNNDANWMIYNNKIKNIKK